MRDITQGKRLTVSPAKRMVMELLHHARKVPSLPLSRLLRLELLQNARHAVVAPPSWMAIFIRAYSLAARKNPELRRALIPWPVKHYYEHPENECALLVERAWQNENIVLGAKIRAPENQTLSAIDTHLRFLKETPVLDVASFRQILRFGSLPSFIRRFTFWQSLYLSGYKRAKRLGTFMISSLGNLGVEQHHPLTPLTTYFTFGPIDHSGQVNAKIIYDHRVLDGRRVARCLQEVEEILLTQIRDEVAALSRRAA